MLQLDILSGTQAGTKFVARRFPFTVGRSQQDDLQLMDSGVWDRHLSVQLERREKVFKVSCQADARLEVNGESLKETTLRNGDLLGIGGAKIRVGLTTPQQKALTVREITTWVFLALLCLAQIAIIYLLSR